MSTEDKIREAMKQDFRKLYVKRFTTDWRGQRMFREAEIDIMGVSALADLMAEARRDELNMLIDGWHPLDGDAGLAPRIVARIASLAEDSDGR